MATSPGKQPTSTERTDDTVTPAVRSENKVAESNTATNSTSSREGNEVAVESLDIAFETMIITAP
jgi:hypothetical protein